MRCLSISAGKCYAITRLCTGHRIESMTITMPSQMMVTTTTRRGGDERRGSIDASSYKFWLRFVVLTGKDCPLGETNDGIAFHRGFTTATTWDGKLNWVREFRRLENVM